MTKVIQLVIGTGNKSIVIETDGKPQPLSSFLEKLYGVFKEEDDEINKLISGGVITTKTNECKKFESDKVLTSLIKIGMPFDLAIKVLEKVIKEIQSSVMQTHTLSSKEIRRYVADAIRNIELVDRFEAEEWSYRYTRKYGHDSRRIIILNCPYGGNVEISYPLIKQIIQDAFIKVIPKNALCEISSRQLDNIANYIIEFINGCDVYYFHYNILQSMVIEMACQPPHPWLITEKTRERLYDYDIDAIRSNILQIEHSEGMDESAIKYCCFEIVHHASALVLEKYKWFLGSDDFTSFYILKDLVNKYNCSDFSDIISLNNSMQKLERDISLLGESIVSFSNLMADIQKVISGAHSIGSREIECILKYGALAIDIVRDRSVEHVVEFLRCNWEEESSAFVLDMISKVLGTLVHASNSHAPSIEMNLFRFVFKPLDVAGIELKKQYLVVYVDKNFDYNKVCEKLCGKKYTEQASTILVFAPNDEYAMQIANKIDELTNSNYWCIPFSKYNLIALLESDNPAQCFYDFVAENTMTCGSA